MVSDQLCFLPQRDGKWIVAYGLRGEGLVWLIEVVVCLLAANRGFNCSFMQAMDGCIVLCGIISSCQLTVFFEIATSFLVLIPSHVRSTVASTGLYLFYWRWVYTCVQLLQSDDAFAWGRWHYLLHQCMEWSGNYCLIIVMAMSMFIMLPSWHCRSESLSGSLPPPRR